MIATYSCCNAPFFVVIVMMATLYEKSFGFVVPPAVDVMMKAGHRCHRPSLCRDNVSAAARKGMRNNESRGSSNGRSLLSMVPKVWIEDAEDGFVDEDENLEPGEVCLKSIKSFAGPPAGPATSNDVTTDTDTDTDTNNDASLPFPSINVREITKKNNNDDDDDDNEKRFLSAGALVQRPSYDENSDDLDIDDDGAINSTTATDRALSTAAICDAWTADSILTKGGPNLQLQGALQVLDELFLFHLKREHLLSENMENSNNGINENITAISTVDPSVRALRNFVLHCGEDDEDEDDNGGGWRSSSNTDASYMASRIRGFAPLKEMVRVDSIFHSQYYDHDLNGMVFDYANGFDMYRQAATDADADADTDIETASTASIETTITTAQMICELLPEKDAMARHTTKRFTIGRRKQ